LTLLGQTTPVAAPASAAVGTPIGAPPSPAASGFDPQYLVLPLMLLAMYFFIFAPQMKKQKEHQKLLKELKPGDEVVTTGGIHGVITQVKPDRFVVEIAKGTRVEVRRAHVEARASDPEPDKNAAPAK
jgi:preprotein translocase subunit YajC